MTILSSHWHVDLPVFVSEVVVEEYKLAILGSNYFKNAIYSVLSGFNAFLASVGRGPGGWSARRPSERTSPVRSALSVSDMQPECHHRLQAMHWYKARSSVESSSWKAPAA